jgi:SAM-dependent methyltransferase
VLTSVIAWEFAKGKLWGDPIYRSLLFDGQLPSGGTLVDVGCGTGLTLALLDEAAAGWRNRRWPPAAAPPPVFDRLVGIELRPRAARLARQALGASATIVEGDARRALPAAADAMLFFDVLQMLPGTEQVALLAAAREAVTDGGVMLIREADAAAGRRFTAIKVGNRFKALAFGYWSQAFHFRTAAEWTRLFESLGFVVERREMGGGTPFGNVLFRLSVVPDAGSTTRP